MTSGSRMIAALGVLVALLAVGCSSSLATQPVGDRGPTGIVALLLPDKQSIRYETADAPAFEAELGKACPDATVDEQNADGNGPMQQLQGEAEIAKGARVLVLDAQDGSTMGSVVGAAAAPGRVRDRQRRPGPGPQCPGRLDDGLSRERCRRPVRQGDQLRPAADGGRLE